MRWPNRAPTAVTVTATVTATGSAALVSVAKAQAQADALPGQMTLAQRPVLLALEDLRRWQKPLLRFLPRQRLTQR